MGYFSDLKDFAEMSGPELAAELAEATERAEKGTSARERSAGAVHAQVVREAMVRVGMRPPLHFRPKHYRDRHRLIPARGQYEEDAR
jgi:hypothetical protein